MANNYSKIVFLATFINWKPIYRKKQIQVHNKSFVYNLWGFFFEKNSDTGHDPGTAVV